MSKIENKLKANNPKAMDLFKNKVPVKYNWMILGWKRKIRKQICGSENWESNQVCEIIPSN